jgi:hypothetical protein
VLKERQTVEDLKVPAPPRPAPCALRRAQALSGWAGQESLDTVTAALERMAASPARRPPVIYFDGLGDNIGGWQVCAQSTEHKALSTKHKNSAVRGAVRAGPAGCVSTGSRGGGGAYRVPTHALRRRRQDTREGREVMAVVLAWSLYVTKARRPTPPSPPPSTCISQRQRAARGR